MSLQRFAVVLALTFNQAVNAHEVNHEKIITDKFKSYASDIHDVVHFEKDLGVPAQHAPLEDGKLLFLKAPFKQPVPFPAMIDGNTLIVNSMRSPR